MAPEVTTAGLGIASSLMGANAQQNVNNQNLQNQKELIGQGIASNEKISANQLQFGREQLGSTEHQQSLDRADYESALGRGQNQLAQGEQSLVGESGQINPELGRMESDIATGNAKELQQGAGQMAANLAGQGVRGGQAATLINRGTGEQAIGAQKDVNQMKYNDISQKEADLRAYMANKARAGQTATLAGLEK